MRRERGLSGGGASGPSDEGRTQLAGEKDEPAFLVEAGRPDAVGGRRAQSHGRGEGPSRRGGQALEHHTRPGLALKVEEALPSRRQLERAGPGDALQPVQMPPPDDLPGLENGRVGGWKAIGGQKNPGGQKNTEKEMHGHPQMVRMDTLR